MLSTEELQAIKDRCEKATQGATPEWYVDDEYSDTIRCSWSGDLIAQCIPTKGDAEFIANARQDIPMLLAEIERLRSELHRISRCTMSMGYLTVSDFARDLKRIAREAIENGEKE